MGLESNCPDGKEDRRTYFAVFMVRAHEAMTRTGGGIAWIVWHATCLQAGNTA